MLVPDVVALLKANLQGREEAKILFSFCDNGAKINGVVLGVYDGWSSSPYGTT